MRSDRYRTPIHGEVAEPGDIVQCKVGIYSSIRRYDTREVQRVEMDCYVLRNGGSPVGTSHYRAENFTLLRKLITPRPKKETKMAGVMFLAVRLHSDGTFDYKESIDALMTDLGDGVVERVIVDRSYEVLKRKVEARIKQEPNEKWLLFSGTTLAETSAPPVTFRSA